LGKRKILRSEPRQEGYNDISDTPVTKADLADVMSGFAEVVRAEAKAGTLEAINEHKKECKDDNDGRYVQKDSCQKRREDCTAHVYDKIDKRVCADGHNCPPEKEDEEEDPSINISITTKAFDHFTKNKLTYGVGVGMGIAGSIITFLVEHFFGGGI
jgi:hypothetical protein